MSRAPRPAWAHPTLWLALVVIAIAAYTFYDYRKSQDEPELAAHERKAFRFKPEAARELRVTRAGETFDFVRADGVWRLKAPVEDLGESTAIDGFLWGLAGLRLSVPGDKPAGALRWSDYGLEPAAMRIEVKAPGGEESLEIGGNAVDGSFYVRQGDELLLGDTGLAQVKERSMNALRERRLWREGDSPVDTVAVTAGPARYAFKRQAGGEWAMEPRPAFETNDEKIVAWIDRLRTFSAGDIVKDEPGAADREAAGLARPSFRVEVGLKKDGRPEKWVLTVGPDRAGRASPDAPGMPGLSEAAVTSTSRPTLYRTSSASLEALRVGPAYFRETKKPFAFTLEAARAVEVDAAGLKRAFVKTDDGWKLKEPQAGEELDQTKLVELMQALGALEAREFPARPPQGYGADFARPRVIVRGADGAEIFRLSWGDEYRAREPYNRGAPLRYAKVNGEKDTMGVPKEKLDKLIDPSIIKRRSKPDTENSKK